MVSTMTECLVKVTPGGYGHISAMVFSANGEQLWAVCMDIVHVWRVKDGREIARISVEGPTVDCLAASKDGHWIATTASQGGSSHGPVMVWNAHTYQKRHVLGERQPYRYIMADFSPDSTRLVGACKNKRATIWDIATGKEERTLCHEDEVWEAKYSPQGDCIVTRALRCIRVWDSEDGRLLNEIPVQFTITRILWSRNQIIVASDNIIKKIDTWTALESLEWQDWKSNTDSRFTPSLKNSGELFAYASGCTFTFWDMSSDAQPGHIQQPKDIASFALSPTRDGLIAIADLCGVITIQQLTSISAPIIEDSVLELWKRDQLRDADAILTEAIPTARNLHHLLAGRSLVRTRSGKWGAAVDDAKESIKVEPCILGYVALSVALVHNGEKSKAYRAYDMAFQHCQPPHVTFLLLFKAIVVFMAGEHDDAISRVNDLMAMAHIKSTYRIVQAYMYFMLGKLSMENHDYIAAIQSFECARSETRRPTCQVLLLLSLISGWEFDNLNITIQRQLCEALYAAGHTKKAAEVVHELLSTAGEDVYVNEDTVKWVSDFTCRLLSAGRGCKFLGEARDDTPAILRSALDSLTPSPLLNEWTRATLTFIPWKDALADAVCFTAPTLIIYRSICEHLEAVGRLMDASRCSMQMANESETTLHGEWAEWMTAFRQRCAEKLEQRGDVAAHNQRLDKAISRYSASLSLTPHLPRLFIKRSKAYLANGLWEDALRDANQGVSLPASSWDHQMVLAEWAKVNLTQGLWKGAMAAARDFGAPNFTICRMLCECLEEMNGMVDAVECYRQLAGEWTAQKLAPEEAEWICDFKYRNCEKLGRLGDAAMDTQQYDEALKYYSAALSIHSGAAPGSSVLRCKILMAGNSWKDALDHANEAIALDPSSPWGYEAKDAALHGAGRYNDAIKVYEAMLSKMSESSEPQIRERRGQYVNPFSTRTMIRRIVQRTIRHSPRVLIDTTTGRLHSKVEQEAAFMSSSIVSALVSSMTTRTDRGRIKDEVRQFFQYVMFSHKWEDDEPLYQDVIHVAVYDLDSSPTHEKLKTFCRKAEDAGFKWAWSDTCCINKEDNFVLQEALVAMFMWYRNATMVFVFLRGVRSPGKLSDLVRSPWNTRAWTLQEYIAAKVIRFYTEDWTPYRNLDMSNHKESPEIISEMELATGVSAQQLATLRPGLSNIREKLCLASTRQTTFVEDSAYSLLGIFSVSGISAIYGEREKALGRLLAHILTVSGDTSVLAWTGQSSGHNSCLPAHITVFSQPATPYLPQLIEDRDMETNVTRLRSSTLDLDLAMKLYDRLNDLPAPCSHHCHLLEHVLAAFFATTTFGVLEIKTRQDLSRFDSLYLVHPWLDVLLGRGESQTGAFMEEEEAEDSESSLPETDNSDNSDEEDQGPPSPLREWTLPPRAIANTVQLERETRALRLVVRIRRPFGALLLSLTSTRRGAAVYKRVAADSEITVNLQESVSLNTILESVRTLDVL